MKRLPVCLPFPWLAVLMLLCLGAALPAKAINPIDTARWGMIWTQTTGAVVTEDFTSIDNVYLNGGLDTSNHPLAPGYYYVTITSDLAGFNKLATSYPAKPVFVTTLGVFQQPYKLLGAGGIFPALAITKDVYYYVWIGKNPFTVPPCYPELERCRFRITDKNTPLFTLIAFKFWDLNKNGTWEPDAPDNEPPIAGWKIQLYDSNNLVVGTKYTDAGGLVAFDNLPAGNYTLKEVMQPGWVATTPTEFAVTIPPDGQEFFFGNTQVERVTLRCGHAAQASYWYSDKGRDKFLEDEAGNLAALVALNLVDAAGNPFDPIDYTSVANWMKNSSYTNDAYALSVQLAVMVLNVRAGFVSESEVVYNASLGFITIANLDAAADAALALDGYTLAGDPNRPFQDVLRKTLTAANNNLNFVF